MKEYDLGDDAGLITVKLNGKSLTLCPAEVMSQIDEMIGDDATKKSGAAFLRIVVDWLEKTQAVHASIHQAGKFYETITQADKEIADFFSPRPDSSTTSEATPEAGAEPSSPESAAV